MLGDLGKVWRITEVAHKPFPSGRATHGMLDGCMQLQAEHGFAADELESAEARVPRSPTISSVGRSPTPWPRTTPACAGPMSAPVPCCTVSLASTISVKSARHDPAEVGARQADQGGCGRQSGSQCADPDHGAHSPEGRS